MYQPAFLQLIIQPLQEKAQILVKDAEQFVGSRFKLHLEDSFVLST